MPSAGGQFHISGTKWASPGTQDTVGQFRDDPGHSGTVSKHIHIKDKNLKVYNDV